MEERPPEPSDPGNVAFPPPPVEADPPHAPPPPPPLEPSPPPIPWEQAGVDIFSAFFRTVQLLLSSPRKAFERVPLGTGLGRPFAFGFIVSLLAAWGDTFWQLVLGDWWKSFIPSEESFDFSTASQVAVGLTAPLWVPIVLMISVSLQHLFLFLVGGSKKGFGTTLRALSYSWAPHMLALLPVCGQLVGVVWGIVLSIIGLSVLHRISLGKAALAVFLPLLLCCACLGLGVALFGAAILAALGGHR